MVVLIVCIAGGCLATALAPVVLRGPATRYHDRRIERALHLHDEAVRLFKTLQADREAVERRLGELERLEPWTNRIGRKYVTPVLRGVGQVVGGGIQVAGKLVSAGYIDLPIPDFGDKFIGAIAKQTGGSIARGLDLGGKFNSEELQWCEQALPQLVEAEMNAYREYERRYERLGALKETPPTQLVTRVIGFTSAAGCIAVYMFI